MPQYKLTYFDIMGLGEPIRYLFHYGNVEFVDIRLIKERDWEEAKNTTPFGQVPVLEVDGKAINQSKAICRYVAAKVGLDGKDELENLQIDAVVDTIYDLRVLLRDARNEKSPEVKKEKREKLLATQIPFYIGALEKLAIENDGHLTLKRLTWADLFLASTAIYLNYLADLDLFQDAPNLRKLVENVNAIETIKKWIERRPMTKH